MSTPSKQIEAAPFAAKYKCGDNTWDGASRHQQVDTGLGFTCDAGVLNVVLAFNYAGIETVSSCERWGAWYIPRKFVAFKMPTSAELFRVCEYLQPRINDSFELQINLFDFGRGINAFIQFVADAESSLMEALRQWRQAQSK